MRYSKTYNLWATKDGIIYRYDKKVNRLILSTISNHYGYEKAGGHLVQRIVWDAFNGPIPKDFEVDHINDIRTDNRLENLQLLTHKDNCNKPHRKTLIGMQKLDNHYTLNMPKSEFGRLFSDKYGYVSSSDNLYQRQYAYWKKYGRLK